MAQVALNNAQTGFSVSGDIRFNNVLKLRRQGNRLMNAIADSVIEVDLAQVSSSDTSGLSLLVRWMRFAEKQNKQVKYKSIPAPLMKVATVCGVAQLVGE